MKLKLLIVDDEKPLRDMLAKWFARTYDCQTAPDAAAAMAIVEATPDLALILSDFKMPGEDGLSLVHRARAVNPHLATMILTAHADINMVIEALRDGVTDFVLKPVTDLGVLEERMAAAIAKANFEREVDEPTTAAAGDENQVEMEGFTGDSPVMERIYRIIRKVAPTEANVLVNGPSGTGKELVARAIHQLSKRAEGPFVAVECASLPASLLETELFGAVKGAYTDARDRAGCFETADGGTIFLDEIGEIDLATQVKLLRVLETRTFQRVGETRTRKSDFRLVAATNQNLPKLVSEGKFREDLYYRLNVIEIRTPALNEHPEDIPALVDRYLKEAVKANGIDVGGITPEAMAALKSYAWPGNVRQLRNTLERLVVLASGPQLTLDDLPEEFRSGGAPAAVPSPSPAASTLADTEKQQILAELERCHYNKSKAAAQLGISRRTLHRKLTAWGIS